MNLGFRTCALLITLALVSVPAHTAAENLTRSSNPERLAVATEAIGVVRYFHPHEAVTVVDWNRVLSRGFEQALADTDDAEFSMALAGLLSEIGSGISHIEGHAAHSASNQSIDTLDCESDERPTRWVHEGFGAAPAMGRQGPYSSHLGGVDQRQIDSGSYAVVATSIDAEEWHGKELIFEGQARLPDGGQAALWIRVDGADNDRLAFDNMNDRLFESADWESRELSVSIDPEAEGISLGLIVYGDVSAEFRHLKIQAREPDSDQAIGSSLMPGPDRLSLTPVNAEFTLESNETDDGIEASILATVEAYQPVPEVMAIVHEGPTRWAIDLIDDTALQVPLALCPGDVTLNPSARERLLDRFPSLVVDELSAAEKARLDVATLWTVMQHFYPYRDKLVAWQDQLPSFLEKAGAVTDYETHERLLQRLVAAMEDGHGRVYETNPEDLEEFSWLPVSVSMVDSDLVITGAIDDNAGVMPGDRITAIDGKPTDEWMQAELALFSGSPQWRTHRAIQSLLVGTPDEQRRLTLERDGDAITVTLRHQNDRQFEPFGPGYQPTMPDGISYVDLRGLGNEQWAEQLPELVDARGVIFDLRGYPGQAGYSMLSHLLSSEDDFNDWMQVLTARSPNGDLVTGSAHEWNLQPVAPLIKAPIVFLTDQRAMSYAESVLGLVQFHQLATIVGSNTAGANGNVLPLILPGGFTSIYTGMRVIGPDGNPFHGEGIEPDVRVTPTLASIKAGRDAVLERALELLQ